MKTRLLVYIVCILATISCRNTPHQKVENNIQAKPAIIKVNDLPRETQKLVPPPFLPDHEKVVASGSKIIEVKLEAVEKNVDIGNGVIVQALTFNGSIPGPIIVAHQNDYIEVTLKSDSSNLLRHTVDFHAATGALGGASLMKVDPGESKTIRFKAVKAGVFVYHCAPGGGTNTLPRCIRNEWCDYDTSTGWIKRQGRRLNSL